LISKRLRKSSKRKPRRKRRLNLHFSRYFESLPIIRGTFLFSPFPA
jgi:hypothetical protein